LSVQSFEILDVAGISACCSTERISLYIEWRLESSGKTMSEGVYMHEN